VVTHNKSNTGRAGRSPRRRLLLVGMATIAVLATAACSSGGGTSGSSAKSCASGSTNSASSWEAVVSAANCEGAVTIYANYSDSQFATIEAGFNKEYPNIKVTLLRVDTSQIGQKVEAEIAGGVAGGDVILQSNTAFQQQHADDGQFAKLIGPNITSPSVSSLVRGNGTFVLFSFVPFGYGWNTQNIAGSPTLPQLLTSHNAGRIGIVAFTGNNVSALNLQLIAQNYKAQYGGNLLQTLASLNATLISSQPAAIQELGAGQINVLVTLAPSFVPAGLPIGFAYPARPIADPILAAVVAKSKHLDAAQVFANWTMTPAGQEVLNAGSGAAIPNVPGTKFVASRLSIVDVTTHPAGYYTSLIASLTKTFGK
jgi:iron(III) transport system substrate-binding protein